MRGLPVAKIPEGDRFAAAMSVSLDARALIH